MTGLIHRIRAAPQTISVSILTVDLLDPDAAIMRLETGGVQLTEAVRPDILITVDGGITKANLADVAGPDPDSTVAASAIIDGASAEEYRREWSATVMHGHW